MKHLCFYHIFRWKISCDSVWFGLGFLPKSSQELSHDDLWHPTVLLFFEEGRKNGVFETAPRLLAVQKYAMHQNDIQPLHQNVIQPNENKSRKTNKFPVFYWGKVSLASVFPGLLWGRNFFIKMQESRKIILKNNFSLLEMEYVMAIVISLVNTEYSLLSKWRSWNK